MKALISPNEQALVLTDFYDDMVNDEGIIESINIGRGVIIPNGVRIAEISENQFEVAPPLFWVNCNTSVNANDYYYDTSDNSIKLKSDYTPS